MRFTLRTKKSHWIFVSGDDATKDEEMFVELTSGDLSIAPLEEVVLYEEEEGNRGGFGFNAKPLNHT